MIVALVPAILMLVSLWIIFKKAGHSGWKALVPVYNLYVLFDVAGDTSGFWAYLVLTVLANIITAVVGVMAGGIRIFLAVLAVIISIVANVIFIKNEFQVAEAFGKGVGFGFLLWLLPIVGYPILAFGSAEHYITYLQTNT